MAGAYIGLFVFDGLRGDAPLGTWTLIAFFLAMLISMGFSAVLGMSIERIAYKPTTGSNQTCPASQCYWCFIHSLQQCCMGLWHTLQEIQLSLRQYSSSYWGCCYYASPDSYLECFLDYDDHSQAFR